MSIIIPTSNSAGLLRECLDSVREQTYSNIETVVVDDHSRDGTQEIAKEYGVRVLTYGPNQGAPFAKVFGVPLQQNLGASVSNGECVYLVDSDMRLRRTVVENCVNRIRKGTEAVIVPEMSVGQGFWAKCKSLEKIGYFGDHLESPRFITKRTWDAIGGLDAKVGGFYDWDLTDRIKANGFAIDRIDDFVIHNEGNLSLSRLIRKKYVYGKYLSSYLMKRESSRIMGETPMVARLTPYRLVHYIRSIEANNQPPALIIGVIIMKLFESIAMVAGLAGGHLE